ncbi:glycogen biosynthesis protein GlgD [Niallia sp. 03133]|uniref:glycogen biosynthesis protein GlgD n=1 Tax=Niallia sp. 03133 TaxID=3458060 RepID=UPI004043FC38
MKKRSKLNNPEQKTRNGINSQDIELGSAFEPVKLSKKKYEKTGGQPVKSKFRPEPEQSK